jgi:hypothetical protein
MLTLQDHASTSLGNPLTFSKCGKFAATAEHTLPLTITKYFYDPLLPLIT